MVETITNSTICNNMHFAFGIYPLGEDKTLFSLVILSLVVFTGVRTVQPVVF